MYIKTANTEVPSLEHGFSSVFILIALTLALLIGGIIGFFYLKPTLFSSKSQKIYHIGVLAALDLFSPTIDGFKTKMTEQGYIEGKNITYDIQKTPSPVGNDAVVQKFVKDNVDLILAFPTEASLESKKGTEGTNIPVLLTNASLDGVKLVNSVREPGGNITGVQFPTTDTAVQRLEILHEMIPNAKRIWTAYLDGYPIVPAELEKLRPEAATLGITLIETPAKSIDDLKIDLEKREKSPDVGIDAILIIPEPLTVDPTVYTLLTSFGARHHIPIGGAIASTTEGGSLFAYIPDSVEIGQQAAVLANKIFKGTPAGTIPVVSAENYLTINYKLAQEMGIPVSDALLSRAKTIIK